MSKFENLTAKADAILVGTDLAATVATYASVTDQRIALAPVWAALTITTDESTRRSLADIGKAYDEPKPTIDRYVRLGLVLVALDKVSASQRETIASLVGAASADRGRIPTDGIKAVANEATSATDAIERLKAAAVTAKADKDKADADKAAAKAEADKAEADAKADAEASATDAEIVAGFAGIVSALTVRLVTMGPDEVDALAALVDSLAASVAARVGAFDSLMAVASGE